MCNIIPYMETLLTPHGNRTSMYLIETWLASHGQKRVHARYIFDRDNAFTVRGILQEEQMNNTAHTMKVTYNAIPLPAPHLLGCKVCTVSLGQRSWGAMHLAS